MSKKDTLDWIVPELARAKLLINEPWVPAHATAAEAMFCAQGTENENKPFTNAAVVMAVVHPWSWQMIQQAPVLVAVFPYVLGLSRDDERTWLYSEVGRMTLGKRWKAALDANPKLRDLLAYCQMPYACRKITPHAAKTSVLRNEKVRHALCSLGESHVAQTLPPQDHQRQRNWLFAFAQWISGAEVGACEPRYLEWLASVGAHYPYPYEIRHLSDFVHQSDLFNPRWNMARALEEMRRWHLAVAGGADGVRFRARHGCGIEEVVRHDDGLPPFIDWEYRYLDGEQPAPHYEFHRLNSGLLLQEEAKAMHHCVAAAGYVNRMIRGRSLIWSMREAVVNKRVATVEFEVDAEMREERWEESIIPDGITLPALRDDTMPTDMTYHVKSKMRMVPRMRFNLRQAVGPCNAKLSGYAARAVSDFGRFVQEHYRFDSGQGRELLNEARVRFEKEKQMLDRSAYVLEASRHFIARPDLQAQQLRRLGLIDP